MSLVGFKAKNHPQQVGKNGANDDVDDRGTKAEYIAELEARFCVFTRLGEAGLVPLDDTCAVPSCESARTNREWCRRHYTRWLRHGDPEFVVRLMDDQDKQEWFWNRVDRRGADECWPWLGQISSVGYGQFGRRGGAHRWAYEVAVGPIPEGYSIDHVAARGCTRRDCVNPAHLEAVTPQENTLRAFTPEGRRVTEMRHARADDARLANTAALEAITRSPRWAGKPGRKADGE